MAVAGPIPVDLTKYITRTIDNSVKDESFCDYDYRSSGGIHPDKVYRICLGYAQAKRYNRAPGIPTLCMFDIETTTTP